MDYKIAILGNHDAILGFRALGLETHDIATQEQGLEVLKKIREAEDYGIIFITEDWTPKLEKELLKLEGRALPAIISIPSQEGTTGEGLKNISKIVEQAVGSDILSNE
ncbi:V-type ATP synthase subunit F [Patescibacteria group bacterium]|nr:V-type ATP synthase subunit F [Patescibacteria group bacterium]MBU1673488.1 V-type ATP synthase subunit F [Patescibacteria group bacterium]MBU1963766.1 V-type ATP synthase subunit F [Patescibacteria group bacterium]